MTRPRNILFDVGGTLLHVDRGFILSCLAERGVHRDDAEFAAADYRGREAMALILRSGNPGTDTIRWRAYAGTLLKELGCSDEDAMAVGMRVREHNTNGRLWGHVEKGTAETLQQLKDDGYRIAVVSNSDGRVAEFLAHAGLAHYFEIIVDSGTEGVEKPDPRLFLIACERLGIDPAETLYVGDLYEIDVVGARAAGITALLIDPADTCPDADCDRIQAIPEILDWLADPARG
ncbi:MAG: HAD family hydrolase [Longimicrobiales bacterium]